MKLPTVYDDVLVAVRRNPVNMELVDDRHRHTRHPNQHASAGERALAAQLPRVRGGRVRNRIGQPGHRDRPQPVAIEHVRLEHGLQGAIADLFSGIRRNRNARGARQRVVRAVDSADGDRLDRHRAGAGIRHRERQRRLAGADALDHRRRERQVRRHREQRRRRACRQRDVHRRLVGIVARDLEAARMRAERLRCVRSRSRETHCPPWTESGKRIADDGEVEAGSIAALLDHHGAADAQRTRSGVADVNRALLPQPSSTRCRTPRCPSH